MIYLLIVFIFTAGILIYQNANNTSDIKTLERKLYHHIENKDIEKIHCIIDDIIKIDADYKPEIFNSKKELINDILENEYIISEIDVEHFYLLSNNKSNIKHTLYNTLFTSLISHNRIDIIEYLAENKPKWFYMSNDCIVNGLIYNNPIERYDMYPSIDLIQIKSLLSSHNTGLYNFVKSQIDYLILFYFYENKELLLTMVTYHYDFLEKILNGDTNINKTFMKNVYKECEKKLII